MRVAVVVVLAFMPPIAILHQVVPAEVAPVEHIYHQVLHQPEVMAVLTPAEVVVVVGLGKV
jgi:hypothetical protein